MERYAEVEDELTKIDGVRKGRDGSRNRRLKRGKMRRMLKGMK